MSFELWVQDGCDERWSEDSTASRSGCDKSIKLILNALLFLRLFLPQNLRHKDELDYPIKIQWIIFASTHGIKNHCDY